MTSPGPGGFHALAASHLRSDDPLLHKIRLWFSLTRLCQNHPGRLGLSDCSHCGAVLIVIHDHLHHRPQQYHLHHHLLLHHHHPQDFFLQYVHTPTLFGVFCRVFLMKSCFGSKGDRKHGAEHDHEWIMGVWLLLIFMRCGFTGNVLYDSPLTQDRMVSGTAYDLLRGRQVADWGRSRLKKCMKRGKERQGKTNITNQVCLGAFFLRTE